MSQNLVESKKKPTYDNMEWASRNTLNSAKTDPKYINNISFSKKGTEFSSDKVVDILNVIGDDESISNTLTPSASPKVYPASSSTESLFDFYCYNNNQPSGQTTTIGSVNSNATLLSNSAALDICALTPFTTPTSLAENFVTDCEEFFSDCNNKSFDSSDFNSKSLSSGGPLDLPTFSANYGDTALSNGTSSILSDSPYDLQCYNLNAHYNPTSNGLSPPDSSYYNNHYYSTSPSHQNSPSHPADMYFNTKTQCYQLLNSFPQHQSKQQHNDPYAAYDTSTQYNSSEHNYNVLPTSGSLLRHQNQEQYFDPHTTESSIKQKPQELKKIDESSRQSDDADAKYQHQHYSPHFNQLPDNYCQSQDMLNKTEIPKQLNDAVCESADNANNSSQILHESSAQLKQKETIPCTSSNIPKKDDQTDRLDMPSIKFKKLTYTQVVELERFFQETPYLASDKAIEISEKIGVGKDQVKRWFVHRRNRGKVKLLLRHQTRKVSKRCLRPRSNHHNSYNQHALPQKTQQQSATQLAQVQLNHTYSTYGAPSVQQPDSFKYNNRQQDMSHSFPMQEKPQSISIIKESDYSYRVSIAPSLTTNSATAVFHPISTHLTTVKSTEVQPPITRQAEVQLTTVHPTIMHPFELQPTIVHPTALQPTTVHPIIVHPTALQPTTVHPTTVHPTALQLTVQPTIVHATTVYPTSPQPTAVHPIIVHPATVHPTTVHPETVHPTIVYLTIVHPTTLQPTSAYPRIEHQTALQPTTVHPSIVHPSTVELITLHAI